MTINLSQHAGGGTLYSPAAMYFDGTAYCESPATVSYSGGLCTMVLQSHVAPFTGVAPMQLCGQNTNNRHRMLIQFFPTDYSDATLAGKISIYAQDSTGATACSFRSLSQVQAGDVIFTTYDAVNGLGTLIINGVDQYDAATAIVTVATLDVVTNGLINIGASKGGSGNTTGVIGYYAYGDLIGNWEDFMTSDGTLKQFDASAWIAFNPYGDLQDNRGTGPNCVATGGTITVADEGSLDTRILGINTIGDAVAADIAVGKIAWVDGVEIIGSLPAAILLLDNFNDVDATLLVDHTPDFDAFGGGWDGVSGVANIQSNKTAGLTYPGAEPHIIAVVETGVADVIIQCTVTLDLTNTITRIVFRYVDNDNFWLMQHVTGQVSGWAIYSRIAGSYTAEAVGDIIEGAGDVVTFTITLRGDLIIASTAESVQTHTDTRLNTSTRHGIGIHTTDAPIQKIRILDNAS